ncbi:hypothetical protein DPMN_109854 [Dreissena polymorpha]|nr:hypothetical protein DPMN_109854 [Dreissena polymorpha]
MGGGDINYYVLAAAGNPMAALEQIIKKESIIFGIKALFHHQISSLKKNGFEDIFPILKMTGHSDNDVHEQDEVEDLNDEENLSYNEPQTIIKNSQITDKLKEDLVKETVFRQNRCKLGRPRKNIQTEHGRTDNVIDDTDAQNTFEINNMSCKYDTVIDESGCFCKICNCSFASSRTLMKHLKRRHTHLYKTKKDEVKSGKELCMVCNKFYKNKFSLRRHQYKMHRGAMPMFECRVCDANFHSKKDLTAHRESEKHDTRAWMRRRILCDDCGKTLQTLMSFREHKKVCQSKERNFKCDQCPMKFKSKTNLLGHKAHVHDVQEITCHVCGKLCKNQGSLRNHSKRHDESNKKHSCNTCGKTFFNASKLKEHIRSHTKEKPYSCNICSYTCAIRTNLGKHLKQLHKLLPGDEQYQKHMHRSTATSLNFPHSSPPVPEALTVNKSATNHIAVPEGSTINNNAITDSCNIICTERKNECAVVQTVHTTSTSTQFITTSAISSHNDSKHTHVEYSTSYLQPTYSVILQHDLSIDNTLTPL